METSQTQKLDNILLAIQTTRKTREYSLENMANELNISIAAYEKIEKKKTRLTVERLLQIQTILEVPLHQLLGLELKNNFYQTNDNYSSGFLINEQKVQNLYQDHQKTKDKLINSLENQVEMLNDEVLFLRKQVDRK